MVRVLVRQLAAQGVNGEAGRHSMVRMSVLRSKGDHVETSLCQRMSWYPCSATDSFRLTTFRHR